MKVVKILFKRNLFRIRNKNNFICCCDEGLKMKPNQFLNNMIFGLGPTKFNRYLTKKLKVSSSSLTPLREFCCGFTVPSCGVKCSEMTSEGYW